MRISVRLDEVAANAVAATVAAEDQCFWRHPGVDPLTIARAARDLPSRPSGASTITQQLARRLYLPADGADGSPGLLVRKGREALIALQLEARHSKQELLEAYLNHVYYGRGAYGMEAAARLYFGVSARHLDLAQASYLAGLPQLPGVYGDAADVAGARARQRYVLDRLVALGEASPAAATEAAGAPLAFVDEDELPLAPHFVGMVEAELARVRPDLAGRPGLVIATTLDASLQREAARSVRAQLGRIADRGAGNAAVLDPASGALHALVGSAEFEEARAGQVNMALAPRQPGSALKPLLYAAAFERGYTAATLLLDVPTSFETPLGTYEPVNFDLRSLGPTPLRVALASSLNVPAVRTLERIGGAAQPRGARGVRPVADARGG